VPRYVYAGSLTPILPGIRDDRNIQIPDAGMATNPPASPHSAHFVHHIQASLNSNQLEDLLPVDI
jgi:hypothetical protein